MAIELIAVLALAGWCWWFLHSRRLRMRRAAWQLLRQVTWADEQGQPAFNGAEATVVHEDLAPAGSADTGPHVVGQFTCVMPSGRRFAVRVQTAHRLAAAEVQVTPLPDAAA